MASPQMEPYPTPMGFFPQFMARQTETLVLKERILSLSGDSFDIKLVSGQPIFQVQGEAFSLSGRKHLSDMYGNHLFTIRRKLAAFFATYYAEDAQGNVILEVKGKKFSWGKSKSVATFTSQTGKEESLVMEGNFWGPGFDTKAEIHDEETQQPVARIDRELWNTRQIFFQDQTYSVTVAPDVDMAIVAAMCICLDERENDAR
ncbi:DUF567-domain-containing protein [Xylariaceae sp. FL0255]|nr:DUF567-domain-containing protein [Xylariaceae sp. FL0255]